MRQPGPCTLHRILKSKFHWDEQHTGWWYAQWKTTPYVVDRSNKQIFVWRVDELPVARIWLLHSTTYPQVRAKKSKLAALHYHQACQVQMQCQHLLIYEASVFHNSIG